jgi:6-phosphogluconolactonase
MTMRPNRWLIGTFNTLCFATLAACGGGGGGGSTSTDSAPTPAGFAYVANTAEDTVSAFILNSAGLISEVDHQQVAGKKALAVGNQPLSLVVTPSGKFVYVANYADNTVSAFAIDSATGKLSPIGPAVAAGFLPSFLVVHPSGNFLYAVNFGVEDPAQAKPASVTAYSIGSDGTLTAIGTTVETGLGPVSMSINRAGNRAYVANKGDTNGASGNVFAYSISSNGQLTKIGQYAAGHSPSSVVIHPSLEGKFVYVTNQVGDSISGYSVDDNGLLAPIDLNGAATNLNDELTAGLGLAPVAMTFDLAGNFIFVANHGSDGISVFRVEPTGLLTPVGNPVLTGDVPYFIDVDPTGKYLYTANQGSNNVSIFSIDTSSGVLSPVGTVGVGLGPSSIATTAK